MAALITGTLRARLQVAASSESLDVWVLLQRLSNLTSIVVYGCLAFGLARNSLACIGLFCALAIGFAIFAVWDKVNQAAMSVPYASLS
jgi:hypothetical protein